MRQRLLRDPQFSFYAVPFIARFAVLHHFLAELLNAPFQLCDVLFQWFFHFFGRGAAKLYGAKQKFFNEYFAARIGLPSAFGNH